MDISVIIPSYRSEETIPKTLVALAQQTFRGTFEVLVIDSSGDGSAARLQLTYPEVTVIDTGVQLFPGAARNRGIERAQGGIFAFVDADAEPSHDWLQRIWELHHQYPEWTGVGGSIANGNAANPTARIAHLLEFSGYTPAWPPRRARVVPTCNLSLKRHVFDAGARFLEGTWGNEDVELVERLQAAGDEVWFEPSLRVVHFSKTNFEAVCRQQAKLGYSTAQVRKAYDLPGSWLARVPLAWLLTPGIKTLILWKRALTHESGAVGDLLRGSVRIAIALGYWMNGFRQGLKEPLKTPQP